MVDDQCGDVRSLLHLSGSWDVGNLRQQSQPVTTVAPAQPAPSPAAAYVTLTTISLTAMLAAAYTTVAIMRRRRSR